MTYSIDNVRRRGLVASWGGGVNQISGFGPLHGSVYWLGWQYPVEVQDHICWIQFFLEPGGGTLGHPLPGAVPEYSYHFGQYNTIFGVTLEMMGGRPIELLDGYVVMSADGETYQPISALTTLGVGTLVYSQTSVP